MTTKASIRHYDLTIAANGQRAIEREGEFVFIEKAGGEVWASFDESDAQPLGPGEGIGVGPHEAFRRVVLKNPQGFPITVRARVGFGVLKAPRAALSAPFGEAAGDVRNVANTNGTQALFSGDAGGASAVTEIVTAANNEFGILLNWAQGMMPANVPSGSAVLAHHTTAGSAGQFNPSGTRIAWLNKTTTSGTLALQNFFTVRNVLIPRGHSLFITEAFLTTASKIYLNYTVLG